MQGARVIGVLRQQSFVPALGVRGLPALRRHALVDRGAHGQVSGVGREFLTRQCGAPRKTLRSRYQAACILFRHGRGRSLRPRMSGTGCGNLTGSGKPWAWRIAMVDILAPISVGELIDKITILRIKRERIHAAPARANVERELDRLLEIRARASLDRTDLAGLEDELFQVNGRLWEVEDELRALEQNGNFG